MSIVLEAVPVDWKIDPRDGGVFVLRKCVDGTWRHEAEVKIYDGDWFWRCEDVTQHLGNISEQDAIDYLWSNRGRSTGSEHHPFCDCEVCAPLPAAEDL